MKNWHSTHFHNFGVQIQPSCADAAGFIEYRKGVVNRLKSGEDVPSATRGEQWIADRESAIEQWRDQNA